MAYGHRLRLLAALSLLLSGDAVGCYTSIFSFGDSIVDTGNAMHSGSVPETISRLPYGQTYFGRATGRFSDGRLVVDFIGPQALGLPLLRPYLAGGTAEDFLYGANFAFAGATALNASFFEDKGIHTFSAEYSLGTQLEWFKQLLPLLCSESNSKDILRNSLILLGEIGGNDYNYALSLKTSLSELRSYVPIVVNAISEAIKVLVELGATTLVVPGNFPIGCLPIFLSINQNTAEEYDTQTGCINWLNDLAKYHNSMLLNEINYHRKLYPHVTIIYADYYEAALRIYRSPQLYGFKAPLSACCGSDDPYNFNWSKMCGTEMAKVCSDPSAHLSWDGTHFTEATYAIIAQSLLDGTYTYPPFNETCANIQQSAYL
ncbi:hypothetical protein Cni_G20572 [Canna indica]|uniref:GDSL esterase/lipase n=1 Tax=Canna indica TaxID=4628 RepID=A0AAQ3KMV9_9LILI|nr:hypothetical protein Cni_G20572 [Canna indica]